MTIYGEGPITIRRDSNADYVNYGGSDYGIIPATYLLGYDKPNFPLPVTVEVADIVTHYRWICGHCPEPNGPCLACLGEYLDGLEWFCETYWK